MKFIVIIVALTAFISQANAFEEKVTTTDGRIIILKDNGTYKILEAVKANWQDYVQLEKSLFRNIKRDFSQVIDYMPNFKNLTSKTIVGIEFTTQFKNVFGKLVQKLNGQMEEQIKAGKSSKNRLFYVFKNNQFIDGETYDKLLPLVTQGTGSLEVSVKTIVFEGGEVMKF